MAKAKILGSGIYAPGEAINNQELQELVGKTLEPEVLNIIENKLGIKKRHIGKLRGINESAADFAENAAAAALKEAGIAPEDVDLFIVGTDTPEFISPATAIVLQGRMQQGQQNVMAFDINATCSSFVIGMNIASRIIAVDPDIKNALVIGVYNMPALIRDDDIVSYSIFSDGAGAIVLGKTNDNDPEGFISGQSLSNGTQWDFLGVYAGGAKNPVTREKLKTKEYGLQLLKPLPPERNLKLWPPLIKKLLHKAYLELKDIDHIFFTQNNHSIINEVMHILDLPLDKTTTIMDRFGYTGSACIPMAFNLAIDNGGRLKKGDIIMFVASGAGLTVSSNIFVL